MECYFFKIVCIGSSGVGKTHFMETIQNHTKYKQKMKAIPETIGVQFFNRMFLLDKSKRAKLHFWDLSGQKRFRDIIETYLVIGDAILLFFDVSNENSFEECKEWLLFCKKGLIDEKYKPFVMLIGIHKYKKYRTVYNDIAKKFADKHNMIYMETNYSTQSILAICNKLIRTLIQRVSYINEYKNRNTLYIDDDFTISTENSIISSNENDTFFPKNDSFTNLNETYESSSSTRTYSHNSLCVIEDEHDERCCTFLC